VLAAAVVESTMEIGDSRGIGAAVVHRLAETPLDGASTFASAHDAVEVRAFRKDS